MTHPRRFAGTPLTIHGGSRYIGSRPAAGRALAPVLLVNLGAAYAINPRFDVTLEIRNLFDRRYQLWDGYTERGFFAAVGAAARF